MKRQLQIISHMEKANKLLFLLLISCKKSTTIFKSAACSAPSAGEFAYVNIHKIT